MRIAILGSIIKSAIEFKSKIPTSQLLEYFIPQNPYRSQKRVLKKLLKTAELTSFSEEYNFPNILKSTDIIKSYKEKVPLFDYDKMHEKWWYRTLNGESYVSWPGPVKYFALSSGTSGASSKYIPVTRDMLRAIQKTSIKQIWTLGQYDFPPEFYSKGILMLGGSTQLEFNGTYFEGDLSGITAGNLPFWFQHFYKPGKRISKEKNWTTKLEEIIKKAPEWDIGVICGVPAWLQILMERIIAEYNLKTIHDIWPNLSIFVHGGVSFAPYQKGFEKLLAKPLVYMETYLASEGFIAYQNRPHIKSMQLVLDNGIFYEFVPFNEDNFDNDGNLLPNATTLTINEVEENKDYGLLITTCSGAWRYLIGDTIRFTSLKLSEIVITGRTKQFLSLCGEHLSLDNLNKAIEMLGESLNIHISEFTVAGIKHQEGMFAHHWYIGHDNPLNEDEVARLLDENLKIINDDYRTERLHAVKEVKVKILPTAVFYEWLKMHGKEGGQHKFPRVLKGEKLESWIHFLAQKNL